MSNRITVSRVSIFDPQSVEVAQDMYEAWFMPELHPEQKQPVLQNWHPEDLVAHCGGEYAKISYNEGISK